MGCGDLVGVIRGDRAQVLAYRGARQGLHRTNTPVDDLAVVTSCRGCQAEHFFEPLFRQAARPAGLRLDLASSPPVLVPIDDWPGIPDEQAGTDELIRRYLTFVGPASHGDVAGWLDTTQR